MTVGRTCAEVLYALSGAQVQPSLSLYTHDAGVGFTISAAAANMSHNRGSRLASRPK